MHRVDVHLCAISKVDFPSFTRVWKIYFFRYSTRLYSSPTRYLYHLFGDVVEYLSLEKGILTFGWKQGPHRTHSDLWLKCYNRKFTFSISILYLRTWTRLILIFIFYFIRSFELRSNWPSKCQNRWGHFVVWLTHNLFDKFSFPLHRHNWFPFLQP